MRTLKISKFYEFNMANTHLYTDKTRGQHTAHDLATLLSEYENI